MLSALLIQNINMKLRWLSGKKNILLLSMLTVLTFANIYSQNKLQATIAGKTGDTTITVAELLKDGKLKVVDNHSLWVTSYRFSAYAALKEAIEIDNDSDSLSPKIKEVLLTLSAGTKIYFEYITAQDASGAKENLPAISFILK